MQKVYFPRLILPGTAATTGLVDFGIASVILVGLMVFYKFTPSAVGVAIVPLLILTTILCALGMGLFLAAINVKYRDVRYALPFLICTLMYVTPVIYPTSMLDAYPLLKTMMIWLNPMSGVITNARAGILGQSPVDWSVIGISILVSAVYFVLGLYYFRNTERYFADII